MKRALLYKLRFAPEIVSHLKALGAGRQQQVIDAMKVQLLHEPAVATRNRKRLRPNPLAPWELRVGTLRVFYDILDDEAVVEVVAIGEKDRELRIAGKVVRL